MERLAKRILFAAILCLVPLLAGFNFPPAQGLITDAANLIEANQRTALEAELRALEKDTGWEVAVVTVPNLEGATIERYAQDLFVAYGIGKKGTDNGVLLLVGRQERKVRIHTGYHAESVITDALAKRIITETIAIKTKKEDWSGGISDGARAIVAAIRGTPAPAPAKAADTVIFGLDASETIILVIILVAFLLIVFGAFLFSRRGGRGAYSSFLGGGWDSDSGSSGGGDFGGFGGGDSGGGGSSGDC